METVTRPYCTITMRSLVWKDDMAVGWKLNIKTKLNRMLGVGEIWEKKGELYKRCHTPTPENSQTSQLLPLGGGNGCEYSGGRLTLPGLTIKSFAPTT